GSVGKGTNAAPPGSGWSRSPSPRGLIDWSRGSHRNSPSGPRPSRASTSCFFRRKDVDGREKPAMTNGRAGARHDGAEYERHSVLRPDAPLGTRHAAVALPPQPT